MASIKFDPRTLRPLLRKALQEDGAWADRTSLAVVPRGLSAKGEILAKSEGILAGLPVAAEVLRMMDPRCKVKVLAAEGSRVAKGKKVALLSGPARALLAGERVALNLLSRLSGVATLTRRFSSIVRGSRVYDTRKTTPLWRELERYAVRVGGGRNHRFNLSGHVLIKDNHVRLGGGVLACVRAARKKYGPKEFIEVEVGDFSQAAEALRGGADILLADNMDPRDLPVILNLAAGKAQVEVSGGVDLGTLPKFAKVPAHRFSSGSLTHSAPSVDFSIELYPVKHVQRGDAEAWRG